MIRTIFVVYGSCGQYSDRCEWTVKAFTTEAAAACLVETLHDTLVSHGAQKEMGGEYGYVFPSRFSFAPETLDAIRAIDPSFSTSYTGTLYSFYPVDLEEVP